MVSHPSQTVVSDPGSSVAQRVQAVNSSLSHLSVGRNLLTMKRTGPINGGTIRRVIGWRIGKMTGTGTIRKIVRMNGTTMKAPTWCVELQAQIQV